MVFAHQHHASGATSNSIRKTPQNPGQKTVAEKCQLCDAMHNNHMLLTQQVYFSPATAVAHVYAKGDYNFYSVALILSAGRSPPSFS